MKYLGIIAILSVAFYICEKFSSYIIKGIDEGEAFLNLLRFMRGRIYCYLEPSTVFLSNYEDKTLEKTGFLLRLKNGENLLTAFSETKKNLSINEDIEKLLLEFFDRFGEGHRDSETLRIDYYIEQLETLISRTRVEDKKKIKLIVSLICAFSLGIVILLI